MTSRKVRVTVSALVFFGCLILLVPASPATAAPCNQGGLLGLVPMCSPGNSSSPSPSVKSTPPVAQPAPLPPQPQPDPGTVRPTVAASKPAQTAELQPAETTATPTTPVPAPSPQTTLVPTPSSQSTAAVAAPGAGGPSQAAPTVSPTFSVAGMLLAFGGAMIAAGGVVGLRRYPL